MSPYWLCIALFASFARNIFAQEDDSIITNSLKNFTTVTKSVLKDSELYSSNVKVSKVVGSKSRKSLIAYSFVVQSRIIDSDLDARYEERGLERKSTADIFAQSDRWFFNNIYSSQIVRSKVEVSENCRSNFKGDNSTIYDSQIFHSQVYRSTIIRSNLTKSSSTCNSLVDLSTLDHDSSAVNSVIRKTSSTRSLFTNSVIELAKAERSRILNSKLESALVIASTLANSRIFTSHVLDTNLHNTVVHGKSEISNSKIMNSKVSNSKITNSIIMNSNVDGKTLDSVTMMNGIVFSF